MSLFHFLRPWWLLAFIPAIVFTIFIIKNARANNSWLKLCDSHLAEHILVGQKLGKDKIIAPLFVMVLWVIATIAMAGPTWSFEEVPVYNKAIPRVIAVDVSESMDTTDVQPSRLEKAKLKTLDMLRKIDEGQTGFVVFSSEPFVVSPLTDDSKTIDNMVSAIKSDVVPVKGHNIAKAINMSADLIKKADFKEGEIIIITDSQPTDEAFAAAKKFAKEDIKTSVFAIGTAKGGVAKNNDGSYIKDGSGNIQYFGVDVASLQKLAKAGDGDFVTLTPNNKDIEKLLDVNGLFSKDTESDNKTKNNIWLDRGVWVIWALAILSIVLFRKGILERICR